MKTFLPIGTTIRISGVLLAASLVAFAQPEGRPGRPAGQPRDRGPMQRGPGATMAQARFGASLERILAELTDEQRRSLRETMAGKREDLRELDEKIRAQRADLLDIALAKNLREEAFRRKAMDVAKLEADRAVIMAKALAEIEPPLSEQQIERIKRPAAPDAFRPGPDARRDRVNPSRDENNLPPRERPQRRPRESAPRE